mmetsp:Transcript_10508/g.28603  ORF Transcript_10508/g.28603 Transcript_10508/m.28603 type:complete len:487 (+) Transcript_10508:68-1528(+)
MDEKFLSLLGRLETVTSRLESVDLRSAGSAPSGANGAGAAGTAALAASSASVSAFDAFIASYVDPWVTSAGKVSDEAARQATHVKAAFSAQRRFLETAAACKKPAPGDLPKLLEQTSQSIGEVQGAVDKRSKDYNCLNAVSEGIAALGWVMVEPTPVPHIEEMKNASDFYGNKVLMQYRNDGTDDAKVRVVFANGWKELLSHLAAYVKEHHRTGVTWNPKGGAALQYTPAGATPRAATSSASAPTPPAPPPPPPPASAATPAPAAPASGMAAVFSQINSSANGITGGLRHVSKGDKSTPPPPVATVKASAATPKAAGPGPSAAAAAKPPRKALEGKKWMVEHFKNESAIVVDQATLKETVYIFKCEGSTVQVKGKVNQITIDSCKKTSVVFDAAMAGLELVNCVGCKVQVTGTVATISVDKCEGTQLILSRDSLSADVISAKSSELNIIVPGKTEADEYKEHAIPEQFISKYANGKWVTTTLEHTA